MPTPVSLPAPPTGKRYTRTSLKLHAARERLRLAALPDAAAQRRGEILTAWLDGCDSGEPATG